MNLKHLKTPLHRYTFTAPKIRAWVVDRAQGFTLNLFAGPTVLSCDSVRNDLNPDAPADYHLDALEFSRTWTGRRFNTIIVDPPYSYRKSMEKYEGRVASPFRQLKDALVSILAPGGQVITFGYHSISMGASRGFLVKEVLVMSHGGAIHDTIATIEYKGEQWNTKQKTIKLRDDRS